MAQGTKKLKSVNKKKEKEKPKPKSVKPKTPKDALKAAKMKADKQITKSIVQHVERQMLEKVKKEGKVLHFVAKEAEQEQNPAKSVKQMKKRVLKKLEKKKPAPKKKQ